MKTIQVDKTILQQWQFLYIFHTSVIGSPVPVCSPGSSTQQPALYLPRLFIHSLSDHCIHLSGSVRSGYDLCLFLLGSVLTVLSLLPVFLEHYCLPTCLPACLLAPLPSTAWFLLLALTFFSNKICFTRYHVGLCPRLGPMHLTNLSPYTTIMDLKWNNQDFQLYYLQSMITESL